MMSDLIDRQQAIDAISKIKRTDNWQTAVSMILLELPSAQPESYKEKLKEIADALSEKFAYMNTCLNERDIILGYLGVKRPSKIHCNTDCTNIKCESHRCNKRLSSAQPEIIRCKECRFHENEQPGMVYCPAVVGGWVEDDWFCKGGEGRTDE